MEKIKVIRKRGITTNLLINDDLHDLAELIEKLQQLQADGYTHIDPYFCEDYVEVVPILCTLETDEEHNIREIEERKKEEHERRDRVEHLRQFARMMGFDLVASGTAKAEGANK